MRSPLSMAASAPQGLTGTTRRWTTSPSTGRHRPGGGTTGLRVSVLRADQARDRRDRGRRRARGRRRCKVDALRGSGTVSGPLVEIADGRRRPIRRCPDRRDRRRAIGVLPTRAGSGRPGEAARAVIGIYPGLAARPDRSTSSSAPRRSTFPPWPLAPTSSRRSRMRAKASLPIRQPSRSALLTRTDKRSSSNVVATPTMAAPIRRRRTPRPRPRRAPASTTTPRAWRRAGGRQGDGQRRQRASRAVTFAFWGAEEFGSHGSRAFVETLGSDGLDTVRLVNGDMVGPPNGGRYVCAEEAPPGSERIGEALAQGLDRQGLGWMPVDIGGRSDHSRSWPPAFRPAVCSRAHRIR